MSRMQRFDWQKTLPPSSTARRRRKLRRGKPSQHAPLTRRLRIETLEDRRLLSAVSVTNDFDVVDGDTSSIANLIATPGDDGISLREAIEAANADVTADSIDISFRGTILLTQGELVISNSLTISGPNTGTLTIDASGNDPTPDENNGDGSRVFNIDDGNDGNLLEVFLEDLTITGGDIMGEGGGIRSRENLTIDDSLITGNSTSGNGFSAYAYSPGGGISSRVSDLSIINSTVTDNSTFGRIADGGGIYSNTYLSITSSTISGNSVRFSVPSPYGASIPSAAVVSAPHRSSGTLGGGIRARNLVVTDSTISGNFTLSDRGSGGGIYASSLTMTDSTVSDNSTAGDDAYGGGIHARNASISGSTISGNSTTGERAWGGGIHFRGGSDSSITGSTISENSTTGFGAAGGGISVISNRSILTITDSTISDNSTAGDHAHGGGILSSIADLTINSSTIYSNSTTGINANGGGITALGGILTFVDSTISDNASTGESASGGGIYAPARPGRGQLNISHSTITDNRATASGGGIKHFTLQLSHTIVSGNWLTLDGQPPVADDISGFFETAFSLVGTITSDFAETPGSINYFGIDPLLGPLLDNGGPTKTHALLAGSPAIDAGDPAIVSAPTFDQRGNPFLRITAGDGDFIQQIDIGAFEVPMTLVVTSHVDELDGFFDFNSTTGLLSLREAMWLANMVPQPANIVFSHGLNGETIHLDQAGLGPLPSITNNVTIDATNLPGGLTVHAGFGLDGTPNTGDGIRVFDFDNSDGSFAYLDDSSLLDITLSGLTITGGDVTGEGGGIRSRENLTIFDSTITGNSTSGNNFESETYKSGGGISSRIGDLTVIDSTVSDNSTHGRAADGGGIYSNTNLTVINSTISGNATRHESLLYQSSLQSAAVVSAPHRSAGAYGGGIQARNLVITDSTVSGNFTLSRNGRGGGISANDLTMTNTTVNGNSTAGDAANGGGIYSRNVRILDSTISGNSTAGENSRGGGIYLRAKDISTITKSTVSGNSTSGHSAAGGGMYLAVITSGGGPARNSVLNINDSSISDNYTTGESGNGGGIALRILKLNIIASSIHANSTTGREANGGGVNALGGILTFVDSTISSNAVTGESASGGGIYAPQRRGELNIFHSTITDNRATASGGGIELGYSQLSHSIVSGNWLTSDGQPPVADDISGNDIETELSYNLIGTITGDFTETPGSVNYFGLDPLLGPLADNGGPTKTHALLFGSPAIDAGDPSIAFDANEFDQRGNPFQRVADGNGNGTQQIDIGAFEVPMTLVVTTHVDEFDALIESEVGGAGLSLREAIAMANMIPQPINITFALWLNSRTIEIDQAGLGPLPTITDNVTIDATNLPGGLIIHSGYGLDGTPDTGDGIRVFDIDDGDNENSIDVGLFGLTITGGDVVGEGGGIRSRENLTVFDSSILNNATRGIPEDLFFPSAGGGIFIEIGDLAVFNSVVSGNSTNGRFAGGGGILSNPYGGITNSSITVTIENSTISGNSSRFVEPESSSVESAALVVSAPHSSPRGGGGVKAGTLIILGSTISDNTTSGSQVSGGGISAVNLTMTSSTVSGNSTDDLNGSGGGIFSNRYASIIDSTISNNFTQGSGSGGGIFSRGGVSILNSTISGNFTLGERAGGGGIHSPNAVIIESTISGNYTVGDFSRGGGIYSAGGNEGLIIRSSTIDNNWTSGSVADGGGIWTGEFSIADSTISSNAVLGPSRPRSRGGGGIVAMDFGSITRSTITNNTAVDAGGGIFADSYFLLSNTIVYGNWITPPDAPPIAQDISGFFESGYSLFGTIADDFLETPGSINYVGIDPLLGPLADNGGPTKTHALLFGSPAIDAGDPSIAFDANEFDQRGSGFFRVADGGIGPRIDLGAFESQRIPTADFDSDIRVTGLDFLSWQRGFSSRSASLVDGDADYDHDVDSQDFAVWEVLFGLPPRLFLSAELEVANSPADVSETDEAFSELGQEGFLTHRLDLASSS